MPTEVSVSDIEQSVVELERLQKSKTAAERQLRQISWKRKNAELTIRWCSIAVSARDTCRRFNLWIPGILIVLPLTVGATAFIATDAITGSRTSAVIISGIAAFGALLVSGGLLKIPSSSTLAEMNEKSRHDSVTAAQAVQNLQDLLHSLQPQIAAERKRQSELKTALDLQLRNQSLEFQCKRLFTKNWRAMRSVEFESYLEEVFLLLGYDVETTKTTGDQGVDLIVSKRGVRIAIQVKGYESSVGNYAVQAAYAGMAHYQCQACAVITNSRFTPSAIALAQSTLCVLVHEANFRDFVFGKFDLIEALQQQRNATSTT